MRVRMPNRKQALLLVDISNIYYCLKNQFGGAKLRYEKFLDFLDSKNYNITRKIGYGSDEEIHHRFQTFLQRKLGFEICRKRPTLKGADWDVGIAVDSIIYGSGRFTKNDEYDAVIFATGDGDMAPALMALKQMGKTVVVIGAKISLDLKRVAHESYEISSDLFELNDDPPIPVVGHDGEDESEVPDVNRSPSGAKSVDVPE